MNPVDFDRLARDVAGGALNRRGALKVLALGALAAGLQALGWRGPNVYAQEAGPDVPAAGPLRLYLPAVQRACTEASRCNARKYCDPNQQCLCVQSAEGPIRCGKIPSCSAKLCTTSADCAELGPGAFCDAPNSGCCSDAERSRCLLPCPTCAPQSQCGAECCSPGQVCRNSRCATPNFCDNDPVTEASLAAAQAALAGGANTVSVSPNGCHTYARTLTNGVLSQETYSLGGFPVHKTTYTGNSVEILIDNDQDGFAEEEVGVVYTTGSPSRLSHRTFTRNDAATRRYIRIRQETWRDATSLTVDLKEYDTAGNVILSEQFISPLVKVFPNDDSGHLVVAAGTIGAQADCTPEQRQHFEERMGDALKRGRDCFNKHKHRRAKDLSMFQLLPRINLVCDTTLGAHAQATDGDFPRGPITITINPTSLSAPVKGVLPGESVTDFQSRVLFHELSHFMVGEHSPRTEYYSQFDPTRACDQLCFNPAANQCHCQTCLGDKTCNNACSTLPACQSSIQQCGNRCCVGPCDGSTCCPSEQICSKKSSETAVCCAAGEVCINLTGGASSCCPAGQVCRAPGAAEGAEGKEICCQPGDTCTTDPLTQQPKCWKPQSYCPGCAPRGVAPKCFTSAADCQAYCSNFGLACPVSCRTGTMAECP
jgi:hypothetical protein